MAQILYKKNSSTWGNLALDAIYPIGSIYMSIENTSPSQLFGGTWVALENRMLIGASSTYTAGSTGGSATTTINSANLPTHTHSIGAHSHGLNSHKHTYDKVNSSTGSTTLTTDQIPSHTHGSPNSGEKIVTGSNPNTKVNTSSSNNWGMLNWSLRDATSATGGGKGHTHTTATTSTNSGAASGNTADSSAFDSGNGGFANSAMTTISPYLAVYMWRRTA